jgi:hypothetical protein
MYRRDQEEYRVKSDFMISSIKSIGKGITINIVEILS